MAVVYRKRKMSKNMTVEEWLPGKIWKCNKKETINIDENSKYAINIDNEWNELA